MPHAQFRQHVVSRLAAIALLCAAAAAPATAKPSFETVRGMEAYNRGDARQAFDLLRRAGEAGDAEALANLGYLYARREGWRGPGHIASLYRRAAALGSSEGYERDRLSPPVRQRVRGISAGVDWFCPAVSAAIRAR